MNMDKFVSVFVILLWIGVFIPNAQAQNASDEVCDRIDTAKTKHSISLGIGTATNHYALFAIPQMGVSFDYQYRVDMYYATGFGVELSKWPAEAFFSTLEDTHVRLFWNNEFYIYHSDAFEVSIKVGVGYAYDGVDRLLGNDGVYRSVRNRSGIEFRTGLDFTWRLTQLVGVKLDTTLADSLYPAQKHSKTANLVFLDMFFKVVFYM